ncbi:hypothetical protein, partial [Streptomyces ossamyceticus]|uniref:hypothetical protein n=1 Tax=Streptomyces ossamyceticus TaxID=249581 RepID=UPI00342E6185
MHRPPNERPGDEGRARHTGLRITVFAAALATTFGTAYGLSGTVDAISPEPKYRAHGAHASPESTPGAGRQENHGGHEAAAPGGLQISQSGHTLDLQTPLLEAGKKAELRFAVKQDRTGRKVTAYQREHGKELHLIVASRDLTVYRHLHPARAADGTWSTPVELPKAGNYRVFADFKPQGGEALTLGADLSAFGRYEPAELPTRNTTATVDDYEVTFSAVNGRACALDRSHLVALPTAPYDRTVTGRISFSGQTGC